MKEFESDLLEKLRSHSLAAVGSLLERLPDNIKNGVKEDPELTDPAKALPRL